MILNTAILFGRLLRKITHTLIKKYYPKIQISGAERIPSEGPVLFCANHPNSLIDPILIGITAKRPVSFMAKAPLFKTPVIGPLMHALGMVPAYRGRDDSSQVKKNQKSLGRVVKGLKEGRAMGIFPEGISSDLRQLGLVRGGASRIALEALEGGVDDLVIIPLGINYERKQQLGSKVWINVGEPVVLKTFAEENASEGKTPTEDKVLRRQLTSTIEDRLKSVIVHLDNAEWDPLLDDLETLVDHSKHKASLKVPKLMRRKRIADALNYFYKEQPEVGEEVVGQIKAYHQTVQSAGLVIDDPILQRSSLKTTVSILGKLLHLIIWFIPATVGTLGNIVPFVITRFFAGKVQQEGMKTTAQARIGIGIPIYLIWYGLIDYTVISETDQFVLITVTNFLLILAGTISLKYWPYFTKTMVHLGHQVRATLQRSRLLRLREELQQIRDTLISYADKYANVVPRPTPPSIKPLMMLLASTVSSILLLMVAFVFYILANQYLFPAVTTEQAGYRMKEVSPEELDAQIGKKEQEVLRIAETAKATHASSLELLEKYNQGLFQLEGQDNRLEVSALLHSFFQARDDLWKIVADYSPDNEIQGDDPQQRQRRAMLFTAALLLRHQMSIRFAVTYKADSTLEKYLNQQDDTYGIPANLIVQVNEQLIDPSYQGYIASAMDGYGFDTARTNEDSPASTKALLELIAKAKATIAENPEYAFSDSVKAALSEAKRRSVDTYLSIQQFVATQIGDFRIKKTDDITNHKIDSEKVDQFHELLEPGDILIERRDWYSSNAFLPGYWPHGALYIGTPEELAEDGLLDDVVKELTSMANEEKDLETSETPSVDGLTHADRMFALVEDLNNEGNKKLNSRQIMEAISEGVYHNTVDHSIGEASSVFALRPKVEPDERAKAIAAAYFYEGREYDFNFDFETPNTLVCTEVIYRCYGGNAGTLHFPIITVMGRKTLPAHELARHFVQQVRNKEEKQQYKLIAWLDSDRINNSSTLEIYEGNHKGEAFERFAETLNRSSITFIMEYKRHGIFALVGTKVIVLFYLSVVAAIGYALTKFVLFMRSKSDHTQSVPSAHT